MATGWLALAASAVIIGSGIDGMAQVVDGDTIKVGQRSIRLSGVDAPEKGQMCQQGSTVTACGRHATAALREIIGTSPVRCRVVDVDRYDRPVATCTARGRDIGGAMVTAGWAVAFTRYSDAYLSQQAAARATRRGLWAMRFQNPADFRRVQREDRAPPPLPPNPRCAIKGNINGKGARIFHQPSDPGYPDVRINVRDGERWFCSVAEAIAAGWRPRR